MRVKTANALQFIRQPSQTGNTMYEMLAANVVDSYLKGGTPPSEKIAEIASEKGFNRDQVHRLVELSNHEINAALMQSEKDQLFTFPTASVADVYSSMYPRKEASMVKAAEFDHGVYHMLDRLPDHADLVARKATDRYFQPGVSKEAEDYEYVSPTLLLKEQEAFEKRAYGELEYAGLEVRSAMGAVRNLYESLDDEDRTEFMAASACVLGIPETQKVAEWLGYDKFANLDFDVIGELSGTLDMGHEVVRRLSALESATDAYAEAARSYELAKSASRKKKDLKSRAYDYLGNIVGEFSRGRRRAKHPIRSSLDPRSWPSTAASSVARRVPGGVKFLWKWQGGLPSAGIAAAARYGLRGETPTRAAIGGVKDVLLGGPSEAKEIYRQFKGRSRSYSAF